MKTNLTKKGPIKTRGEDQLRVQFDLAPSRVDQIDIMMQVGGLDARKDLINNALSILEWAIEEVQAGHEIGAIDKTNQRYEILRMPVLSQAAKYVVNQRKLVDLLSTEQDQAILATENRAITAIKKSKVKSALHSAP